VKRREEPRDRGAGGIARLGEAGGLKGKELVLAHGLLGDRTSAVLLLSGGRRQRSSGVEGDDGRERRRTAMCL
jgi:hypothetical protein